MNMKEGEENFGLSNYTKVEASADSKGAVLDEGKGGKEVREENSRETN